MKKDPLRWMPLDVVDWLLDPGVAAMPATARAGYLDLLCHQWYHDALPPDDAALQKLARLSPEEWEAHKTEILSHFKTDPDGNLRQRRCDQTKQAQAKRMRSRVYQTRNAAQLRWKKDKRNDTQNQDVTPLRNAHASSHAHANAMQTHTEREREIREREERYTPPTSRPPENQHVESPVEKHPPEAEPFRPPQGTTTVFDQLAEIDRLQGAYVAGPDTDPLSPDTEDAGNALAAIDQLTKGLRPGAKIVFLRELAQFDPLQVCIAAHDWLNLTDPPRGDPKRYFVGMVRKGAATKYAKYADQVERRSERKLRENSTGHKVGTEDQSMGRPPADARSTPGFHAARDILRNMPEVQRACEARGWTPTEESDDLRDGV